VPADAGAVNGAEASAGSGAPGAAVTLYLCIEAAGCPTICRHCWAQGLTAPFNRDRWANLEDHTEAAYVRRALAGDWPAAPSRGSEIALVCRPSLDVYPGLAGLYRTRHGNLRADGVDAVLGRAVAHGIRADDELWFTLDPLPGPAELAARYGDPAGLGIHLYPESARYLWLDRAQRARQPGRSVP